MKQKILYVPLACLLLLGTVGLPPTAHGVEQAETEHTGHEKPKPSNEQKRIAELKEKATAAKAARQKTCTNREAEIKKMLTAMAKRASNQIDVFNKINERTQKFYTEKGKVVANYDQLVADTAAKKADAEKAVQNLNGAAEAFTCTVDNPQASIQAVRTVLRAKHDTMKAYKTSVKNLIVTVKSVQSTESTAKQKPEVRNEN